ncbi:MAG: hypothetical protein Q7R91_01925 [bacterium]|nr:hypothetical protein [bacterium]
MLQSEVAAFVATTFPKWVLGAAEGEQPYTVDPRWGSSFYCICDLCKAPVLKDVNAMLGHRNHHVITGDIVLGKGK